MNGGPPVATAAAPSESPATSSARRLRTAPTRLDSDPSAFEDGECCNSRRQASYNPTRGGGGRSRRIDPAPAEGDGEGGRLATRSATAQNTEASPPDLCSCMRGGGEGRARGPRLKRGK